jgi:hypothetical protein
VGDCSGSLLLAEALDALNRSHVDGKWRCRRGRGSVVWSAG